jgi:hypothetical protein
MALMPQTLQLGYKYDSYAKPPEARPLASRDGPPNFLSGHAHGGGR